MSKLFDPRHLDVRRFAEASAALEGHEPVAGLPRVLAETAGRGGDDVQWSAAGELLHPGRVQPQVWMSLRAEAVLSLTCQRCLEPVASPVTVDRRFRFVADEATAAAEDDEAEEDVLALSRSFDLIELIEDELLMALPAAPRHETCPRELKMAAGEEEFEAAQARKENPFAALARLKGGS